MNDYPSTLRPPLTNGFNRHMPPPWRAVYPSVGTMYIQSISTGKTAFFNCQFRFTEAEQVIFRQWYNETLEGGVLPFHIKLDCESGFTEQLCYFTESGTPRIQSYDGNGIVTYSAQLYTEEFNDPDDGLYEHLLFGAENSADNDPETWFNALDLVINEILPEERSPEYYFRISLDLTINKILPEA